jgi:hypothetical protein
MLLKLDYKMQQTRLNIARYVCDAISFFEKLCSQGPSSSSSSI